MIAVDEEARALHRWLAGVEDAVPVRVEEDPGRGGAERGERRGLCVEPPAPRIAPEADPDRERGVETGRAPPCRLERDAEDARPAAQAEPVPGNPFAALAGLLGS